MKEKRKQIPKSLRDKILKNFGYACSFCNIAFVTPELHHVKFFSLGGSDDEENLIPVCPSCHALYPHKLQDVFDNRMLNMIKDVRLSLISHERDIEDNIKHRNFLKAACLLLCEDVRDLVLLFGRYAKFVVLANRVMNGLGTGNPSELVLKSRVIAFAGEMALYIDREKQYVGILEEYIKNLKDSSELSLISAHAKLILARLYGRTGHHNEEKRLIADSYPSTGDALSPAVLEWNFRNLAFLNKNKLYDKVLDLSESFQSDCSLAINGITVTNIMSEIARALLFTNEKERAQVFFKKVLTDSTARFHRRGILITSLFSADTAILLKDYEIAAKYYLLANQFPDITKAKEKMRLEEIRLKLLEVMGADDLNKITSKGIKDFVKLWKTD